MGKLTSFFCALLPTLFSFIIYADNIGTLEATKPCPIYKDKLGSISDGKLKTEKKYVISRLDKYGGNYFLIIDDVGEKKWVNKACGLIEYNLETLKKLYFKPFFNKDTPFPILNTLDIEVLKICGNWGQEVHAESFNELLNNNFDQLYKALDKTIITPSANPETFKKELINIWFAEKGFAHIFCGIPSTKKLHGLHYEGRYLEMQQKGWGGKSKKCKKSYTNNAINSVGINFLDKDSNLSYKCPNSFLSNFSAFDILLYATQAFKTSKVTSGKSIYILNTKSTPIQMTLIKRNNAILTFFATRYKCTELDESSECKYQERKFSHWPN